MTETFNPGIARIVSNGHRAFRAPYAAGAVGIRSSLVKIGERLREARNDTDLRDWAAEAVINAGRPRRIKDQAQAILNAFRAQTMYFPDPVSTEMINSAAATLCLRPGLCVRARDCDDGVVAVGGALMALGMPVQVLKQEWTGQQPHVLVAVQDENGQWLTLDPSLDDSPVGYKVAADQEEWMDPFDPKTNGGVTVNPDFVGVGARPLAARPTLKWDGKHWWEFANGQWHCFVEGQWQKYGGMVPRNIAAAGVAKYDPVVRFKKTGMGTFLGEHTADELEWLVQSRDYFYGQLSIAYLNAQAAWQAKDPQAYAAWTADYQAWEQRYVVAREHALQALAAAKNAFLGMDKVTVEAQWQEVLRAFQKVDMQKSPGDFSDLVLRITAAGYPVSFDKIPADRTVDWDLATYKTADDALVAIKTAANAVVAGATPAVSGLTKLLTAGAILGAVVGGVYLIYLSSPAIRASAVRRSDKR